MVAVTVLVFSLICSICNAYHSKSIVRKSIIQAKKPPSGTILAASPAPLAFASSLLQMYEKVLVASPWTTKIISSAVIGGLGDVLIQWVENKKKGTTGFDLRRFAVFTSVAGLYIAPSINMWFTYLNNIKRFDSQSNFWKAMYMMIIDQTAGAVIINGGFFYAFALANALFPPYSSSTRNFVANANQAIRSSFWITLKTNWASWPLINFVNFLVIPLRYRLLFSNFFAVFWNMFLSNVANKK